MRNSIIEFDECPKEHENTCHQINCTCDDCEFCDCSKIVDQENKLIRKVEHAWARYVELFGHEPHGTKKQIGAMLELGVLGGKEGDKLQKK